MVRQLKPNPCGIKYQDWNPWQLGVCSSALGLSTAQWLWSLIWITKKVNTEVCIHGIYLSLRHLCFSAPDFLRQSSTLQDKMWHMCTRLLQFANKVQSISFRPNGVNVYQMRLCHFVQRIQMQKKNGWRDISTESMLAAGLTAVLEITIIINEHYQHPSNSRWAAVVTVPQTCIRPLVTLLSKPFEIRVQMKERSQVHAL